MRARGWAYRRVRIPLGRRDPRVTAQFLGDGAVRLRIFLARAEAAAPVDGALTYPAVWYVGRASGDASLTVLPLWTWGCEVHVAVARPRSIAARMRWRGRRLDRLAGRLAGIVQQAAERSAPARETLPREAARRRLPRAPGTRRFFSVSAGTGSTSN